MPSYIVTLNYPHRRTEDNNGITLDYRIDNLQSFNDIKEAINYAKRYKFRMKPKDIIHVRNKDTDRTLYYISKKDNSFKENFL